MKEVERVVATSGEYRIVSHYSNLACTHQKWFKMSQQQCVKQSKPFYDGNFVLCLVWWQRWLLQPSYLPYCVKENVRKGAKVLVEDQSAMEARNVYYHPWKTCLAWIPHAHILNKQYITNLSSCKSWRMLNWTCYAYLYVVLSCINFRVFFFSLKRDNSESTITKKFWCVLGSPTWNKTLTVLILYH